MQLTSILAVAALVGSSIAAPAADAGKPPKPTQPVNVQTNYCGNGVTPYCCDTDKNGKYTTCGTLKGGDTCTTTVVCCNANNSIQLCLGNAVIIKPS